MRFWQLAILLSFLSIRYSHAQHNLQAHYGYRGGLAASKFFPSTFNLREKSFSLETNFNLYFSNRAVDFKSLRNVIGAGRLTNEDVNQFIDNLDSRNTLTVGQDFLLLGIGIRKKIKSLAIDWGITITDRTSAHLVYRRSLFELLLRGNRMFAGQTVELSPEVRGRYFREIGFSNAFNVKKWSDLKLRIGYQIKYHWAIAGAFLENTNLDFFTEENGRALNIDYSYVYASSGVSNFSLLKNRGYGLGANIGTTIEWRKRLALDIAFNDIGQITFHDDVSVVEDDESFLFEGLNQDVFNNVTAVTDSIGSLVENQNRRPTSFSRTVGTQLFLQISYQLSPFSAKENPSSLFLTYIKGFSERPGVTTKPRVVLGNQTRLFRFVYLGLNTAFGGLNSLAIGGFIGIRIGNFRFSLQSDDITGFILPSKGTGVGLGFTLRYAR